MTPERWSQIKEILSGAFDAPPAERSKFLETECDGDMELRLEVERLLEESAETSLRSPVSEILRQVYLEPGDTVAHYRIEAKLGEGGMGSVYRALDTQLRRHVAIKTLPSGSFWDSARKDRLVREARAASALNHPNIVTIYEVGSDAGLDYVAMEHVEGRPLSAIVPPQGLPWRDALHYAIPIAEGLAHAHAAGVIHRDLKPDNIMVTGAGSIKLLDFGLARRVAMSAAAEETATANSIPGMLMGTPSYMSPEQVRGLEVDDRSDIFSFGAVLYKMLSGANAFTGGTPVDVMSAVLKDDPAALPDSIPPVLRQIVLSCLEKEPGARFQSTRDLGFALRAISGSRDARRTASRLRPWALPAACAIAAVLAFFIWGRLTRSEPLDLSRYRYVPFATDSEPEQDPAWSPDGKSIAYIKRVGRLEQLMVRSLDAAVPTQLTREPFGLSHANPGARPLWSPDGNRLYFLGERNATPWSASATGGPAALWSISAAGGEPQLVFQAVYAASLSPDGRALAMWNCEKAGGMEKCAVLISSPPGASPRPYEPAPFAGGNPGGAALRFSPDGSRIGLVLSPYHKPAFWILPWPDGDRARPARLPAEPSGFDWMPDSRTLVMAMGKGLWEGNINGGPLRRLTAAPTGGEGGPAVSPDGRRVAFSRDNCDYDIVTIPLDGSAPRPLLATARSELSPSWSPGGRMAFITDRSGRDEIWVRNAGGDERPVVTDREFPADPTAQIWNVALSPDGSQIAYSRMGSESGAGNWISPVAGGRPVPALADGLGSPPQSWSPDGSSLAVLAGSRPAVIRLGTGRLPQVLPFYCASAPAWSPDGRWIACGAAGQAAILLISPDGTESRKLPSPVMTARQNYLLVWSRDAATLYIASSLEESRLDAIEIRTGRMRRVANLPNEMEFVVMANGAVAGSLEPDGRSFATTIRRPASDIWIMEGLPLPNHKGRISSVLPAVSKNYR